MNTLELAYEALGMSTVEEYLKAWDSPNVETIQTCYSLGAQEAKPNTDKTHLGENMDVGRAIEFLSNKPK